MSSDLVDPAPHLNLKKGYYKISATEGIYSVTKKRFFCATVKPNGYVGAGVVEEDGNKSSTCAHIIIKESFHGKTPAGMVIDHIDRVKSNNKLSNLRFATYSENVLNADRSNHSKGKIRPIDQYTLEDEFVKSWASAKEIEETFSYGHSSISACCRGETGSSYGFHWEYRIEVIEGEQWLPCDPFHCSDYGRVRFPTGRITYGYTGDGYRYVACHGLTYSVHGIICTAFTGEAPDPSMVVNHINEIRDDNRAVNLEWLSNADNIRYSSNRAVIRMGVTEVEYESATTAGEQLNINASDIGKACRNVNLTVGGYNWRYKEEREKLPHPNAIPISQYTKELTFLANFASIEEATVSTNGCLRSIAQCVDGGLRTSGGYIWRKTSDGAPSANHMDTIRGTVEKLNPDSTIHSTYGSIKAAAREDSNPGQKTIRRHILSGELYKDFYWRSVPFQAASA